MAEFTEDEAKLLTHVKSPELRKSLEVAREAAEKVWNPEVPRVIGYYTDHGPSHLARVAGWAGLLASAISGPDLAEIEAYLLLCAVYFHDLGMQCDPRKHPQVVEFAIRMYGADARLREFSSDIGHLTTEEQKRVRKNHHLLSVAWLRWSRDSGNGPLAAAALSIPDRLVLDVVDICQFHTGASVRQCDRWSGDIRKRLLAALFRLADELDIGASRVSDVEVIRLFTMDPGNEVYWWLHGGTDIKIQPNNVLLMTFKLNPEDMALEDSVRKGFLERFRDKNQECLSVLLEESVLIRISPDSGVVEDPEADKLPESIVSALRELTGQPSEPSSGVLPRREFEPALLQTLQIELNEYASGAEFIALLGMLDGLEAGSLRTAGGIESLRNQALNALQDMTGEEPSAAVDALAGHVLPRCLYDESGEREDGGRYAQRYRDRLGDWLRSYPTSLRTSRVTILRLLAAALDAPCREQACWTVATVGFRQQEVVNALWNVANSETGDTRDAAVSCIVHLGVPGEMRLPLVHVLNQALAARRVSVALWRAVQGLRDPRMIDAVRENWLLEHAEVDPPQAFYGVSVLADIAADHPGTEHIQEEAWTIVREYVDRFPRRLYGRLLLGSNIAPSFNSQHVTFHLVALLRRDVAEVDLARHHRDLICRRLLDCIRPLQVHGWSKLSQERLADLGPLMDDTCTDSGVASRSQTELGLLKEVAWQVLLCAATPTLLSVDYFENCILTEVNPYVRAGAFEWLACFRIDPVPPSALKLVTEEHDETRDTFPPQYPDRMGAVHLLTSAATWEAFEALLRFGYTDMGHILQDSVTALATVALHLCGVDQGRVLDELLDVALNGDEARWRTAAIGALYLLGSAGSLRGLYCNALVSLAQDENLSTRDRSQAIQTLGFIPPADVSSPLAAQLAEWAESTDDQQVQWAALEAMARLGELEKRVDLLTNMIGLERTDDAWGLHEASQLAEEAVLIICLLYEHNVTLFAPAFAAVLRGCETDTLYTAVHTVRVVHGVSNGQEVPEAVRDALLARLAQGGSYWVSVQDLLNAVTDVLPDDLAAVAKGEVAEGWTEGDLRTLADALGRAQYVREESGQRASELLLEIARSGHYSVRRSAYRSLRRLHKVSHERACRTWAASLEPALRQRAAEACVWLGPADGSDGDWPDILRPLSWDPEPTVREAAMRARDEWLRNAWGSLYVQEVLSLDGGANEGILSRWAYGSALARVGNDDSLRRLEDRLNEEGLAPHVRMWLRHILDETRKQWTETLKNWTKPTPEWTDSLEVSL